MMYPQVYDATSYRYPLMGMPNPNLGHPLLVGAGVWFVASQYARKPGTALVFGIAATVGMWLMSRYEAA